MTNIISDDRFRNQPEQIGLVLSGGGARGAYQAGVTEALAEISLDCGISHPTPIVTGVSAGAINAAYLASDCQDFHAGTQRLAGLWRKMTAEKVFYTDIVNASRSGLSFFADATLGALHKKKFASSLLNTAPLKTFLRENIRFDRIQSHLTNGYLSALAVTAMNYSNGTSVTFVQDREQNKLWNRARRKSERAQMSTEHILSSAAIPMIFSPVQVNGQHYGDGCLRNTAPLSPAIHLGAERLIVVGVRCPDQPPAPHQENVAPSVARIIGMILNALLLDAVDVDMERLDRVNHTIGLFPSRPRDLALRQVEYLWLRPSEDIGEMAGEYFDHLPAMLRYLIKGLGTSDEASELTSYLLFVPEFCTRLVQLGYQDTIDRHGEVVDFLKGKNPKPNPAETAPP